MSNHLTREVHPCERCGRTVRAALRWCWRCPPLTFRPPPDAVVLGTWRGSGARVGLDDAATTTTTVAAPSCSVCGASLAGTTARTTGRCFRLDHDHRAARPITQEDGVTVFFTTEETAR